MIQTGNSSLPPGCRRTREERATMGCTNPGHGREEIDVKTMPDQHILVITGAIVLLVMAVATISVVRVKFPEKEP